MEVRLEGQTGVPLYMTEPPEPSWYAYASGQEIEVRVENGKPWYRLHSSQLWMPMERGVVNEPAN